MLSAPTEWCEPLCTKLEAEVEVEECGDEHELALSQPYEDSDDQGACLQLSPYVNAAY